MDNDHLFVCFSQEALVAPEGAPPFHQNIKTLASELDEQKFEQFFEGRFNWHWYPIVTNGMSSFPAHGDLPGELTEDALLRAIGYAATICAREDGKRFISGLGLLSLLCRSLDKPKNSLPLTKNFMKIRSNVCKNDIDPNIHYWFSKIALYQLNTGIIPDGYEGIFDRAGLNAPMSHNGQVVSLIFPPVDNNGWDNCPGGEGLVKAEIEKIHTMKGVLEFKRSAFHNNRKYWIWLYRDPSDNPSCHFYFYVVVEPDGRIQLYWKTITSKVVRLTPEELVAEHAIKHGESQLTSG
jgi:hypothetical protein